MDAADFIKKYKFVSIYNHILYGIPASVTLAQAIIESNYGKSKLATNANNFFGIKAYSNPRNLPVYYATDDLANEPFRKYNTPNDSFADHSTFLKENNRYASLFNSQNYTDWTSGLQKKGYATSPTYAKTLNSVIEINDLQKLDFWGKNKKLIIILIILVAAIAYILLTKKK